jgi:hypothetical protein
MSIIKKMAAKTLEQVIKMLFKILADKKALKFMITANVGNENFENCKIGITNQNNETKISNFEIQNIDFYELLNNEK